MSLPRVIATNAAPNRVLDRRMLLREPKGLRVGAQSHGQDRAMFRTEPWSGG
jgi:hypothetical protein